MWIPSLGEDSDRSQKLCHCKSHTCMQYHHYAEKSYKKQSTSPAKKGQSTSPAQKAVYQEEEAERIRRKKKKKKNNNRLIIIDSVDPHELLPGVSHLANFQAYAKNNKHQQLLLIEPALL